MQHFTCCKKTDNIAENIHGSLIDTASEVLGKAGKKKKKKKKKRKPWVTNCILDICDKRRSLKKRRACSNIALQ